MTPSRTRVVTLALLVSGAALLLVSGSQVWFRGHEVVEGLPAVPIRVTGRDVAAITSAVGLLALAAAAVMLLVGGAARRVVGVVVAIAAMAAAAKTLDVAGVSREGAITRSLEASVADTAVSLRSTTSWWPWLALVGAVLVLIGAGLAAWRGGCWPSRTARYDTPAEPAADPGSLPEDEKSDAMWKALDRGEDPTDSTDPADPPSPS